MTEQSRLIDFYWPKISQAALPAHCVVMPRLEGWYWSPCRTSSGGPSQQAREVESEAALPSAMCPPAMSMVVGLGT